MKPRKNGDGQLNLFTSRLDQILNHEHPLFLLANKIDWAIFEKACEEFYSEEFGAPGKATRLMVGLHYLKHAFNESDDSVVEKWIENPYWQYFCGFEFMQHDFPIHPTCMTKWRQRIGTEKMELLIKGTLDVALLEKFISKREMKHVNVDTTVQEKNIAFPTDSSLMMKAILKLGEAALERGIAFRQSYCRVAKKASRKAGRYAHAKQYKRMNKEIRFLRTRLGRLIRDIERNASKPDEELFELLSRCRRLYEQEKTDSNKLYSLHEPDVQCISKGKAHKRYEFGCKVGVATSNRGNWFLAAGSFEKNPYDGHTLSQTIEAVERNTGVQVEHAYVDKGYRGHNYTGEGEVHIPGRSARKIPWSIRKRRKRRSAIEPKIGHAKLENRLGRCFLKGIQGDMFNAILAAAGANIRKLLNGFLFLPVFISAIFRIIAQPVQKSPDLEARISINGIAYRGGIA